MSIYRRGEVWWYHIVVKGREVRGSCNTKVEREALEKHDLLRAEMWRERVVGEAKRRSVDEAIDKFLREHEHKKSYRDDLRHAEFWKAQFKSAGVKMLDEVTSSMVCDIRDEYLMTASTKGGTKKPATVNRKLAFISAVFRAAAYEWQWITSAPKFKHLAGEKERKRFLTTQEVVRLVECLPRPYADMALFAVSTGLRQANVLRLRWDQVNMNRRMATFPDELMKNGSPFSCALNATAISIITKWIGQHDEYVFVNTLGERLNGVPSKTWRTAIQKAGLEDVRWHDLRHTWASLLRQNGVNLSDLQEMGGWETASMVQKYAHINIEHLATHASVIDGLFAAKQPEKLRLVSG